MELVGVVLAGGKGTRFASRDTNKVAFLLAGKPIILYGVELLERLKITPIIVVVGFAKESVKKALEGHTVTFVEQKEQLGTANAVALAVKKLPPTATNVLVINGDDPFHKEENVRHLMKIHEATEAAITFTTTKLANPRGMGRIVHDSQGKVTAIVEENDATDEQRKIKEVNVASYIFTLDFLKKYLSKLAKNPVTGEYYLTDLIVLAAENGERIETLSVGGKWKGINSPGDLREAEKLLS